MKTTRKEVQALAKSVREAASRWLACAKGQPSSIVPAYRRDAADLRMVAKLMREGNLTEASNYAWGLDTIVRDCIPNDAWTFLTRRVG